MHDRGASRRSLIPRPPPCRPAGARSASVNGRSGCIRKAEKPPSSNSPIDIRNGRYQLPVTSITKPATSGETIAANAEPVFISPDGGAGIFRRNVHRHRPHRADHELGEEEAGRQAQRDDRDVVDEQDREQREQRAGKARDGDAQPRQADIAGALEDVVREHAADAVADHAGEEHAGGEQRRVLDVEAVVVLEEQRQPVEVEPQASSRSRNRSASPATSGRSSGPHGTCGRSPVGRGGSAASSACGDGGDAPSARCGSTRPRPRPRAG